MQTIRLPIGQWGYTIMKAGSSYSGTMYYCIQCLGRVTFTTLADAASPANSFDGVSLSDGTLLWGYFSDATVSTGTAIAYKIRTG